MMMATQLKKCWERRREDGGFLAEEMKKDGKIG